MVFEVLLRIHFGITFCLAHKAAYKILLKLSKIHDQILHWFDFFRRNNNKVYLRYFNTWLIDLWEFLKYFIQIWDALEIEESVLLGLFYLELVVVVIEQKVFEFGWHLVRDGVVKMDVGFVLVSLIFVELQLVVHVTDSKFEFVLLLLK